MKDEQKYGYWDLNMEKTWAENGKMHFVCNCSACGYETVDKWPNMCPQCYAIMVDPLDRIDINGRDICAGDIVICNIAGHEKKVKGKIIHDTQWYLDNPVGFRWIYDCDNFEIVEGTIPKGKRLSMCFGNSVNKKRR